jgi:pimeloyl-ACP methyl ester carboxylesterase
MDTSDRRRRRPLDRIALAFLIAVGLLVAVACTGGSGDRDRPEPTAFQPTYETVDCPDDVLPSIPDFRTCGFVTVPENRSKPAGRTIRLFVVRVEPPSGDPAPDPVLSLGSDLGWRPYYTGIAPLTQRVHREVIILDARGVGHSDPSLSCPEVDRLRLSAPGVSTGDPRLLPTFLDAVTTCRDRLVSDGVDLSAYNLAKMAADVEDVRIALGIDEWNLAIGGTWSTVAFEVMRRYAEHVRTVVFNSPDVPQVDLFSEAVIGIRYAVHELSDACRNASGCRRAFPGLERMLREDLVHLRRTPARIQAGNKDLTIRDSTTVRLLREWLAVESPATLPSIIHSLHAEASRGDGIVASTIADQLALSLGYAGPGVRPSTFSHGTFYSVVCHDELPFVDRQGLRELAIDEPWFMDAYVDSSYLGVCERWDVGRAASDPHELVTSDVPTLVVVGVDPFSPLPLVKEAARGLARSWIVEIPTWGHNVFGLGVLGSDCARAIRDGWIDDPTSPPDTSCIADLDGTEFETK